MEDRSRGETKQNSGDPISDQEDSQKRKGKNGKAGIIKERIRIFLSRWKGAHLLPNPMNEN